MKLELKFLAGFPCYKIDIEGNIYSEKRIGSRGGILKQFLVKGYYRVSLWKDGVLHQKQIHRLVAEAFIPNPKNKPQVNHINGIKTDNHIANLEWVTPKENSIHAFENNLSKSNSKGKFGYESNRGKEVIQLDKSGMELNRYGSLRDAERKTGIRTSSISLNINGKLKTAGGFIWKQN